MRPAIPPLIKAGQGRTAADLCAPWASLLTFGSPLARLWPGLHRIVAVSLMVTAVALAVHAREAHAKSKAAAVAYAKAPDPAQPNAKP